MDSRLPLTRRALLAAGGAGAVTLAGGGLLRGGPHRAAGPLPAPVRSMFTPHVGSTFVLRGDAHSVRARLVAAEGEENVFSLLLHADGRGRHLEQTVARLEHPAVRTIPLLVSPSGTGRHGQDYSIIVNRSADPQL